MVKRIIYIIMALTALSVYSMQKLNVSLPKFVNNYVNDLLCMPLVLGLLTFLIRYFKKDKYFSFLLAFVLLLATYYSIYFEYYLPKINPRYTADWIDVLLYFFSSIAFFIFQNNNRKKLFQKCVN